METKTRSGLNAAPYAAYNSTNRSQSPGPYGGSRLRPSEGANTKRRSNSMSNVGSALKNETSPASKIPTPAALVPSRKPVPGQS